MSAVNRGNFPAQVQLCVNFVSQAKLTLTPTQGLRVIFVQPTLMQAVLRQNVNLVVLDRLTTTEILARSAFSALLVRFSKRPVESGEGGYVLIVQQGKQMLIKTA